MKRAVIITLAMASLLSVAAPAMAATAYPIGTVNLRSGPGTQYTLLGALNEGQSASVVGHEGQWLKVRTGSGTVGYMADWFTREVFDDEVTYLTIDTDVLNIRTQPDLSAPVVGQVVQGDRLRLIEGLAGWYKVDLGSAGTGWVKAEYTYKSTPVPATAPPNTAPPEQPPAEPPRAGLGKQVIVSASTAMYVGRNVEYDVVASPRLWERLTYLDSLEGWVKVQNAAGVRGWIDGRKVQLIDTNLDWTLQAQYTVQEGTWSAEYLRVREVVQGAYDLALRSGSSSDYPVIARVQPGQKMKLLTVTAGEYVRVLLPDGTAGWLSRNYLKFVPGAPSEAVSLTRTGPGVLRLEVKGAAGAVAATADTLTVGLPQANRNAALAVGEFGVGEFSLDSQGLVVRFTQDFRQQVVERTADHLVIELRPVVESASATEGVNGLTYRFGVAGSVIPAAHREGGDVVMTLPGARLGDGVTPPAGVQWQSGASGVTVRVASTRSYAVKRGDGYVDLVLYSPGLAGKTIVVDPGHGGSETGAIGYSGLGCDGVMIGRATMKNP
ncbi:MAG TPA: SH3 domain-containing protein, partial [Symbiobacteriaceae bacterium]|nr:SH3 domain-containing protein [Symbiobacteriaceae bacterium]